MPQRCSAFGVERLVPWRRLLHRCARADYGFLCREKMRGIECLAKGMPSPNTSCKSTSAPGDGLELRVCNLRRTCAEEWQERGFDPPTPCSRNYNRFAKIVTRLVRLCGEQHRFTRFSVLIGSKLNSSFQTMEGIRRGQFIGRLIGTDLSRIRNHWI